MTFPCTISIGTKFILSLTNTSTDYEMSLEFLKTLLTNTHNIYFEVLKIFRNFHQISKINPLKDSVLNFLEIVFIQNVSITAAKTPLKFFKLLFLISRNFLNVSDFLKLCKILRNSENLKKNRRLTHFFKIWQHYSVHHLRIIFF